MGAIGAPAVPVRTLTPRAALIALLEAGLAMAAAMLAGAFFFLVLLLALGASGWLPAAQLLPDLRILRLELEPEAALPESLEALAARLQEGDPPLATEVRVEAPRVLALRGVPADRLDDATEAVREAGFRVERIEILGFPESLPLALRSLGRPGFTPPPALVAALLSGQSLGFLGVGFLMRRLRRREAGPGDRRVSVPAAVALGVGTGAVALAAIQILLALMRLAGFETAEQPWVEQLRRADPRGLAALAPWIVLLAPWAEEVFFRGYMYARLRHAAGMGFGLTISAAAFALGHFHPPLLPAYWTYGALLAWAYERSGTLLAPVTAHVLINGVAMASLLALPPG